LARLRFGLFFGVFFLGYWLSVGGDNFEDRFLLILIPLGIPLMFELVRPEGTQRAFLVALAVGTQLAPVVRDDRFGKHLQAKYDYRIFMGHWIRERYARDSVVATPAAGKIPFYSELKTIDMLGLCEKHIGRVVPKTFIPGHSKEDPEYVLSLKPDLFATAFLGDGLDIGIGLSAERYRRDGYRIRAVFNTTPEDLGARNVIEVGGMSDTEVSLLAHSGWRGVVIERPRS
jgi:hypothetical protein